MSSPASAAARLIAQLRATLDLGTLPDAQKKRGTALLERLTSPIRLTVLGLPQSGKSEVVNVMLGQRFLPTGQGMPTTRLIWGPELKCVVTGPDGSATQIRWPVPGGFDWSKYSFAQVEAPIDLLRSVSILEVVTDGSPENMSASVAWSVNNSDMAIWCTQAMGRIELAVWKHVPDALKDHSFLAVPKADQLAASGTLAAQIKALGAIAEDEFYGLFPVSSLQYLAAAGPGRAVEPKVRAATGAGALIDAVMGDIRRGRQADLDGAEVFVGRHGTPDTAAAADRALAEAAAAPKPAPQTAASPAPATPKPVEAKPAPEPARAPAAAPKVAVAKKPQPAAAAPVKSVPGLDAALDGLGQLGRDLSGLLAEGDQGLADRVLDLCVTRFEDIVADLPPGGGDIADEIEAASESMILMQLEGDESSAADAVTVILQLRRELELAMAA